MSKRTAGHLFTGIAISDNLVAMQVTLNQLEAAGLKSPWQMAKTSLSKTDRSDLENKQLRVVVQRAWDVTRAKRADLYAEYLGNIHRGKIKGSAPPVTLFTPADANDLGDGDIALPFRSTLIGIDGETQLEARFRLREQDANTGDLTFAAMLHHGIEEDHAIQILHDYNRYAKPIPESKLGPRNTSGGLSQTVIEAQELAGIESDALNKVGTIGTSKHVAGFAQAMHFVTGYALGKKGLAVNASGYFDELNRPGALPINSGCPNALASMFKLADGPNPDFNLAIRKAGAPFWQVAGVIAAEGGDVSKLKWDAAFAADKALGTAGRGGPRPSRATRQQTIYVALKS